VATHPSQPYPPTPAHAAAYYVGIDDLGHEISLRRPAFGEVLCGPCLDELLSELGSIGYSHDEPTPEAVDVPWALRAEIDAIGVQAFGDEPVSAEGTNELDSELEMLFPASGQPGHDCSLSYAGPVWIVRQDDCGADARAHVLGAAAAEDGAQECRCGILELFEALEQLPAHARQEALDSHLKAMNDLYDHMMAAEALIDGAAGVHYLDAACLTCMTDPSYHVEEIDAELQSRTLELAPVLRAYHLTVTLGTRRPAGLLHDGVSE
jgi:hypothetical protein